MSHYKLASEEFLNSIAGNKQIVDVGQIKIKCFEFATEITKMGIYSPDEVMEEAKKIFDWVMDNEAFKNQE